MGIEILVACVEILAGLVGLFALYRCMRQLRSMAAATDAAKVWHDFGILALWAAGSCIALVVCAVAGARALGVLLLATIMALMVIGAGGAMAWLRVRTFKASVTGSAIGPRSGVVLVRSLVPGRIRGQDDDGLPVKFDENQVEAVKGVHGRVRMLNWATASRLAAGSGVVPMMAFWNEQGDEFILYPDDDVVVEGGKS